MISRSLFKPKTERQKSRLFVTCMQISILGLSAYLVLTSAKHAIAIAVGLFCHASLFEILERRKRYCPYCESYIGPYKKGPWCFSCNRVVEPQMLQLGRNGIVELNNQVLTDESQPVCRVINLLLMLAIREESQQVTIMKSGQVWFTSKTHSYQLKPMPDTAVPQVKNTLQAFLGLACDDNTAQSIPMSISIDSNRKRPLSKPQCMSAEATFATSEDEPQIHLSLPVGVA